MVGTTDIYETIMTACFNKLKYIRNSWNTHNEGDDIPDIVSMGWSDYKTYNFMMEQTEAIISEMIPHLILELFKKYTIKCKWFCLHKKDGGADIFLDS